LDSTGSIHWHLRLRKAVERRARLQTLRYAFRRTWSEAISFQAGFANACGETYKGLKPIVLFQCMYGLKPVPFREERLQGGKGYLRAKESA
jgi:hypothetical protein